MMLMAKETKHKIHQARLEFVDVLVPEMSEDSDRALCWTCDPTWYLISISNRQCLAGLEEVEYECENILTTR